MEATSILFIDLDRFPPIGTDGEGYIWTDCSCDCYLAFDASSCGAIASIPGLSILIGKKINKSNTAVSYHLSLKGFVLANSSVVWNWKYQLLCINQVRTFVIVIQYDEKYT